EWLAQAFTSKDASRRKNHSTNLFKMLLKYRPEDKVAKKERLLKRAQAEAEGK
uniref:Uncharacterized protein n=1 Tax=Aegilops tauschii subsp. strangulata TaxID=200361 RepID=A0A453L8N3_AEGTS